MTYTDFVYCGSFDPWTNGHLSIITNFLNHHNNAIIHIVIGNNNSKKYMFSSLERKNIIINSIPIKYKSKIKVVIYDGIISNYMYINNIKMFIKGVRDVNDFNYESKLASNNTLLYGNPLTLLIPQTDYNLNNISSSNLKALNDIGISLKEYTNGYVRECIRMYTNKKLLIGVTGGIASGKSTLCRGLVEYSKSNNIPIYHINMDILGHGIYSKTYNIPPLYIDIRQKIINLFGLDIKNSNGTINRTKLSDIVFNDYNKLKILTDIMIEPILYLLHEKINSIPSGIILIESAILISTDLTELVDHNIINITVDDSEQINRLTKNRGITYPKAKKMWSSQLNKNETIDKIKMVKSNEYDRLYTEISSNIEFSFNNIYNKLKLEYTRRLNVIRHPDFYIPEELKFKDTNELLNLITESYNEPHRHYHTLKHIHQMLNEFKNIKDLLINPNEFYLAILFHDIVYDINSIDNELKSVMLFDDWVYNNVLNYTDINLNLVRKLIMSTKNHDISDYISDEYINDIKLFIDIDMSILGSNWESYLDYEFGIKLEYGELYNIGRFKFLTDLLTKPIFQSQYYVNLNEIAKINIQKILDI